MTIAAIALVLTVPAAAAARANVKIGAARIVVQGSGAGAVIKRDPLQISYRDGSRRTVLRGLAGSRGAAQLVPTLPRPQFAASGPPPPTLYRPLAFLVGTHSIEQFPTFQWEGNLDSVTEGGTEYAATAVERARRIPAGVRLTLATSDPSGRKLIATVDHGPEARGDLAQRRAAPGGRRRGDLGLLRQPPGRVVPRLRRPPQRDRPARQRVPQLDPAGEPELRRGRTR